MLSTILVSVALVGASVNMVAASDDFVDLDFQSDLTARSSFEESDFLLDFDTPAVQGPGGSLAANTIDNTPILATLPDGGAQGLVRLNPCGIVAAHHHPGSTEISYVLYGKKLRFTLIEEIGGRFIEMDVPKGQTILLPRGLVHATVNDNCEPAAFLPTFPNEDPATVFAAQTFFQLPADTIAAIAPGVDHKAIKSFQEAAVGANPFGVLESCRKRCGL